MNTTNVTKMGRRLFLKNSALLIGATGGVATFGALTSLGASGQPPRTAALGQGGYGPLSPKSELNGAGKLLALPDGFSYLMFGVEGGQMSDGNRTPKGHDGMAAFDLPNGNIRLIRNHEDRNDSLTAAVKGDPGKAYDTKAGGGTTSLEVRINRDGSRELVRDFVSIGGTHANCAGGPSPFNSGAWLTCEETTHGSAVFVPDGEGRPFLGKNGFNRPHGYVFEVPASAEEQLTPRALTALGRFTHEAVAVDPGTGIIYQTEDDGDAGFYRFIPNNPNDLAAGGTLQMLAIRDKPNYDTRTGQVVSRTWPAVWVDIDAPDSPATETNSSAVFEQGFAKGGATFARLEGCFFGNGVCYFTSTSGGNAGLGQVWEYRPVGKHAGKLKLVFESPGAHVLDGPDNITVSPRGGLLLCEDGGSGEKFLRGLTRDSKIFDFAQNLMNSAEWTGTCFSPDGETLFVNIQGNTRGNDALLPDPVKVGMSFAIWGPWENGVL